MDFNIGMVEDDNEVESSFSILVWNNGCKAGNCIGDAFRDFALINWSAFLELITWVIGIKLLVLIHSSEIFFSSATCEPFADIVRNKVGGLGGGLLRFNSPSSRSRCIKFPASIAPLSEYDRNNSNLGVSCSITPCSMIDRVKLIVCVISCASTTAMNNIPSDSTITSASSIIEKKKEYIFS